MKQVKIALLGLGNVGSGVWKILNFNKSEIFKRCGFEIEIKKILVNDINKKRYLDIPDGILTNNFCDILNDDSIEIVIEVMGGAYPALDYMIEAMKKKKHIVTANKLCIALHGDRLFETALKEKVFLYYEASVGGGIPIIKQINESLTANKIEKIVGIVNGTTNYILSNMTESNMSFDKALCLAKENGFAEFDPTDDIEGFDAAYKLSIMSSLSFEAPVHPNNILREGISNIRIKDINYAKKFGYVIKLLAIGTLKNNSIEVRVHPAFVPKNHPFASVKDSFNAVYLKGNAVGDLTIYGKGAGDLPTGSAIVSDLLSILRNNLNYCGINQARNLNNKYDILPSDEIESEYYIRLNVKDKPGIIGDIGTLLGENNISISLVTQDIQTKHQVDLIFLTQKCKEKSINNFKEKINNYKNLNKLENIIRIENLNN
ncbi:MAG: homoserine dehydrogenase [Sarcina ventriculi]|uniref:Homoserine dehydrogenase n=1 Tax=Sarcina ventriculi TaxID=1267 RepID=A0ABP2AP99_SARVE|nr:homoserine dehydrogenase [Sarcina ventriculi]MDO4403263.1 homoserine dehydrogenase [Clostridiaceae bacterium]MBU5321935.1 homoserine dehydrogenase [Sarcina ventriculi]MCI5637334.1 homoserine dehydrogenase [Sarcina ventriculi]MDD7372887.1 homoserine dehydrogenase [Sarcina ventriculi]MDY7063415.1 homoserine dehydrogenase [Sarcina ventriculi]